MFDSRFDACSRASRAVMVSKACISMLNVDGICYAIKLLRADKLIACSQHGVVILGAESVISKAVKLRLCSFRKVIVCLLNKRTLWLARILCFDYTYYLRIRAPSLSLLSAKRVLHVMSSSLLCCSICANLALLTSSMFCTRYHNALCCSCTRFIKKIM